MERERKHKIDQIEYFKPHEVRHAQNFYTKYLSPSAQRIKKAQLLNDQLGGD